MKCNHIIHIRLVCMRIGCSFAFILIHHNAVRLFPGGRIMLHFVLIDVLSFCNSFDIGISRIADFTGLRINQRIRHINQFNRHGIFITGKCLIANFVIIWVSNRDIDQRKAFLVGDFGRRITDLDDTVSVVPTALMANGNADIDIIADIVLGEVFLINLQAYIVVDIVGFFQFDRILSVTCFTLDEGHPERRIVIIVNRIGRH